MLLRGYNSLGMKDFRAPVLGPVLTSPPRESIFVYAGSDSGS